MKGSIVRIQDKGFGFIKPDEGDRDVFFHASAVVDVTFDDLNPGDPVMFDVEEGPKGPSATNVRPATGSDAPAEEAPADAEAPAEEAGDEAADSEEAA